jgi:4-hydroxy-3-methylbut-2-enyl diphosphate reductase
MKIFIAEEAGFCFGVKRALRLINQLHEQGNSIQIYGQLIHNTTILKDLKAKGIECIDSLKGLDPKKKIVIRTHGISQDQEEKLKREGFAYIDVTCPLVKKLHFILEKLNNEKKRVIIIGDKTHPEIIAAKSYCSNVKVINSIEDLEDMKKVKELSVVAQTTLDSSHFKNIVSRLIEKAERIEIYNTICEATKARQMSIKKMAPRVDSVVVIGGKNSSNTQKLFDIASQKNENTYYIEESKNLYTSGVIEKIRHFQSVGITAGASTNPEEIEKVKNILINISN